MSNLNLSLAQIHVEIRKPEVNLQTALAMILEAANQGSQIVLLPELWTSGYDLSNCDQYIGVNTEIITYLHHLAVEKNILIGGSFISQQGHAYRNSFLLLGLSIKNLPVYHKIHLFRLLEEEKWLIPGDQPVTYEILGIKAGLSICYDLRFPELFRYYQAQNVDMLLNVAQWVAAREDHWKILLRARAIENQFFVAAVNAVGSLNGQALAGSSAVISPWGEPLIEASTAEEDLLSVSIDLDQVTEAKKLLVTQPDNRKSLYSRWYQL